MINFLPAHPKEHDEQEYLEEGAEDVGVAAEEENEGDEGGDAAIEDSRAHVHLKENIKIDWESNQKMPFKRDIFTAGGPL